MVVVMHSERRAIAKNTVIQVVGKGFATLFGLLSFTILWRLLGPADYGTLTIALTFLAVFATFVDFGLTLTTVQLISEFRARESEILGNLLSLRLISAGLFLGSAPFVALLFPYEPVVYVLIAIGILSYYSASITQMLGGVFQKRLDMIKPMIAENVNRVFVLAGLGILWFTGANLISIMWVFVAGNIVQLTLIIFFTRSYSALRPQISWETWKLILGRSWPIGASIFFNLIYLKGDIVFLSLYRDSFEIGLYGTAYKIIEVIAAVPVMYMGLILPILVHNWSSGKGEGFSNTLQDAFNFFSLLALPVAAGLALVGTDAIVFVAGEEFRGAGPVLYLLGPAMLGVFFGALFGHAIVGLNKQRAMTKVYALVAVLTVAGYLWHIPEYGMYGAAFWTLISELLIAIIAAVVVLRVSRAKLSFSLLLKSLAATLLMSAAVFALRDVSVLIRIAAGIAVYFLCIQLLGGPSVRDLKRLISPR